MWCRPSSVAHKSFSTCKGLARHARTERIRVEDRTPCCGVNGKLLPDTLLQNAVVQRQRWRSRRLRDEKDTTAGATKENVKDRRLIFMWHAHAHPRFSEKKMITDCRYSIAFTLIPVSTEHVEAFACATTKTVNRQPLYSEHQLALIAGCLARAFDLRMEVN
jgi:hypothetical protein